MKSENFKQLLLDMDSAEMAQHSVMDHHVEGMHYLCLHRSEKLTAKLYFIDPAEIHRRYGDYLVVPHTHRYAFESTVLVGDLTHVRFKENDKIAPGGEWERYEYNPDVRGRTGKGVCGLSPSVRYYGDLELECEYWNGTNDIHTLCVPRRFVLLGLMQYADTAKTSTVYLERFGKMVYPESSPMNRKQASHYRDLALGLLG